MKTGAVVWIGLGATLWAGCGTASPTPVALPAAGTTVVAAPVVTAAPTATAVADVPPVDSGTGPVKLHPVQKVWSLIDVTATEGAVEVRLGYDPGGGILGEFRYAPIVNGAIDLAQETGRLSRADTAGGFIEIAGKRPDLVYHDLSGFRSSANDHYYELGEHNLWSFLSYGDADDTGIAITSWSAGRLLEWRDQEVDRAKTVRLPRLRVLRGADKKAPTLTKAQVKRLTKDGFSLETYRSFATGEVVAVGRLGNAEGFGTVVWRDKLDEPVFFTTVPTKKLADEAPLAILGGDSLADLRLRAGDEVMRLDGSSWAVESAVAAGAMPDVWFGTTIVMPGPGDQPFVRLTRGAPWRPLDAAPSSLAVDAAGTIWATVDDVLLSSKPPASPLPEITEDDVVNSRKKSILRGGSEDTTGEDPSVSSRKCRSHYVLLARSKGTSDTEEYSEIRKSLAGHTEFDKARFIVSRERGEQFFGATLVDETLAVRLETTMSKALKSKSVTKMCAEPPVFRELKIHLATGDLVK